MQRHQLEGSCTTRWAAALVGFAAAADPLFPELKRVAAPEHLLPVDMLPSAETVIVFFLPFARPVATSNIPRVSASRQWAIAYIETNHLISAICKHMMRFLQDHDRRVAAAPATHNFDPKRLLSNWSHRHAAYIAGLGTFGLNNMVITGNGCCGRFGSFVTDLRLEPDRRMDGEACLYRHDGSCLKCVARCVNGALFEDRFDRHRCYDMCLRNAELFAELGTADVCGKCLVGLPCSFTNPVEKRASSG